jgi:transcription-repair coupling factor (superfamily II helicase)
MTMDLSPLLPILRQLPGYDDLRAQSAESRRRTLRVHLPRSIRPAILAALHHDLHLPILYVSARQDRVLAMREELPAWNSDLQPLLLPEPGPLFYEMAPWGEPVRLQRAAALAALTRSRIPGLPEDDRSGQQAPIVISTARALMTRTLSPQQFLANSRVVRVGSSIRFQKLLELLVKTGYATVNLVTEPGQFSRRGGILDLWPPLEPAPVRIEFFGDTVDSMRSFAPASQRTEELRDWLCITPAREGLPRYFDQAWSPMLPGFVQQGLPSEDTVLELFLPLMNPDHSGVLDFLPEQAIVMLDDGTQIEGVIDEIEEQAVAMRDESAQTASLEVDFPLPYLTWLEIQEGLQEFATIDFGIEGVRDGSLLPLEHAFTPGPRFGGQIDAIIKQLDKQRQSLELSIVVSRQAPRLAEIWQEQDGEAHLQERLPGDPRPGDLVFVPGPLSEGWILDHPNLGQVNLLTDAELFGWTRPRPRRRSLPRTTAPEQAYADLSSGDLVVHIDYGIGRFQGLVERTLEELRREYLLIEYADGDQLFVPIHQADRISRYVGADAGEPALSRLGGSDWERSKSRAREAVEQVARDLLELYARRLTVHGMAFSKDTPWQHELEASFSHQETEDQIEALQAIKHDMEQARPMDRLICGDVGYGKTEVALRAAFKAVMDGKQVAILVPTTVLAQQHFHTFRRRLAAFPVEIEMLSRFRSRSEAASIVSQLSSGEIDIVIGTHRLLQPDVEFKDLGLLIIDEEQRFGVTHKEFLKQMRTEVDVLTLTATPIPRTLYMALTGARDISTISTPPEDRLPVITNVGPYEPRLIRAAVLRELDRGGQVFFVHNRVQTIATMMARLEALVPEARFGMAHGQMPEAELSQVMDAFSNGDIDVLVSTSIIESGLDIPNANTLIVDRADRFGLAQLYQLRGRVGRAAIQGYAYFFRPVSKRATEEALQRLEIIAENSQLGAGYAIAMRDLEMRGAGEILGTRQHGYINTVGFHLYTRLLASAVRRVRVEVGADHEIDLPLKAGLELPPSAIDLPLAGAIPDSYIEDRNLRLQLYRRLAEIRQSAALDKISEELNDRFGPPPVEVQHLLYQLQVKIAATHAGVDRILTENGQILLEIPAKREVQQLPDYGERLRRSKRGIWLQARGNEEWGVELVEVLKALRLDESPQADIQLEPSPLVGGRYS